MRRLLFALSWLLILTSVRVSEARGVLQGDQCALGADERVDGNLFVLCRTLVIDGVVDGNLYGAATSAEINGTITGSIYLLSGQLDIYGEIGENLHFVGAVTHLHRGSEFTSTRGDLISLGLSTHIEDVDVPDSVVSLGYQLVVDGDVGREVTFWGSSLTINGVVSGDVEATVGDSQSGGVSELRTLLIPFNFDVELVNPGLYVKEPARIEGQLHYTAPSEGQIVGQLANPPSFTQIIVQPDFSQLALDEEEDVAEVVLRYVGQIIREFITLALIGSVMLLLAPGLLNAPARNLRQRPLSSLGVGLLSFIVSFPVLLIFILLSFTIVFIVAVLGLQDLAIASGLVFASLSASSAGLFYFVAIFVARAIFCLAAGKVIVRLLTREDPNQQRALFLSLLIGVALLAVLSAIPVVGWFLNAIAAFLGLGAVVTLIVAQIEAARDAATRRYPIPPPLPTDIEEARQLPPPIVEDSPNTPGTGNLPEGFKWWS